MRYNILSVLLACLFCSASALSQESVSLPFLQANPDLRTGGTADVVAMHKRGMSLYTDAYALLSGANQVEANYSLALRPAGDYGTSFFNTLGVGYKFAKRHALLAGFRSMREPKVPLSSQSGQQGEVYPHDYSLDLGYAMLLTPQLSGMVRLSYLNSYVGVVGDMLAGSLALSWHDRLPTLGYAVTLSLNNVGPKMQYESSPAKIELPTDLRLGASLDYSLAKDHSLSLGAGYSRVFMGKVNTYSVGLGYTWREALNVRAGFVHASQNNYWTFGLGYDFKPFSLDLSYRHSSVKDMSWLGAGIGLYL